MKIIEATRQYVAYKQSIGMDYQAEDRALQAFVKEVGGGTHLGRITSDAVIRYLNGKGPLTRLWHRKHDVLRGFWKFVVARGYTDRSPVPTYRPPMPTTFVPYIYTREEMRRLLDGISSYQKKWCKLEPVSFRTLLLLLYGSGMRLSEAVHLVCADVDLADASLTIRLTKFYKTRRIALGNQLCGVLADYNTNRAQAGHRRDGSASFLIYKDGDPLERAAVEDAFLRLRQHVGIRRTNARYQPRVHDLRHTFAVHRVVAWYESGADVQRLLPALATHLGHVDLASTQKYLTMTPELLAQASLRFERYAGEVSGA